MSQINLYEDFLRLYNDQVLEPLSIQYKDFAEWEHTIRTSDFYLSQREFWLKSFEDGIPELKLPTSFTIGDDNSMGGHITFSLSKEEYVPVIEALKKNEVTDFAGFYSLFYLFMVQLTGQEDITIGINTSGRMQNELQNVVGMFVKTLPIRYKIDTSIQFADFADHMNKYLIEAISKQVYDLADIKRDLKNVRGEVIRDLFQVMFVFQNYEYKPISTGDTHFANYSVAQNTYKYPITLFAFTGEEQVEFKMEYSAKYFTEADVHTLAEQFRELVKTVAKNVDDQILSYIDGGSEAVEDEEAIEFNF
jgi:surfactin family lipopeptide synthetase A